MKIIEKEVITKETFFKVKLENSNIAEVIAKEFLAKTGDSIGFEFTGSSDYVSDKEVEEIKRFVEKDLGY